MSFPSEEYLQPAQNRLIMEELSYDREALAKDHAIYLSKFNAEQRHVYNSIISSVDSGIGVTFFVYGSGGTGKTFLWSALSAAIRSKGEIVLNVASSGIASLLLPGGRTAHSRFKISLSLNEDSFCTINQGSPLAELIIRTKLIIWDEAPMMHKYCFEALDRTLHDLKRSSTEMDDGSLFGGITVVFGGDFRQILPVIPKGGRQDVVNATINSSYIWDQCKVLRLTKNMRLLNVDSDIDISKLREFSEWLIGVGDGVIGDCSDGCGQVVIPADLLLECNGDPLRSIVSSTYPTSEQNVEDVSYLEDRAILAPTLEVVEMINQYMMAQSGLEDRIYLSADSALQCSARSGILDEIHTPKLLNGIRCSGIPNHELHLTIGTPVMLLRNIDHNFGLCNGTRLVITRLGNYVLEAKVLTGRCAGDFVLVPRLCLITSDIRLSFKFQRRQFPLIVSYAMTINKSQWQFLSHVGLFLKKPVFSHGQLYVAISRVKSRKGLKILACGNEEERCDVTDNVVYKEVFRNV